MRVGVEQEVRLRLKDLNPQSLVSEALLRLKTQLPCTFQYEISLDLSG